MEDTQKPVQSDQTQTTQPTQDQPKKSLKPLITKYIAPAGVVAVTLVLAVVLVLNKDSIKKSTTTAQGPQDTAQVAGADTGAQKNVDIKDVDISNEPYYGDANAKVTLAYWSDFQCPYCKQFETTTMQTILTAYVSTGKVKLVFKDFQFLGQDSLTAALYARAVWELYPKEYFPWREAMFNKQDAENGGFGDEASVKALTATISGIDVNKVVSQIATKQSQYQAEIQNDRAEGAKLGVTGTPGFITGKQLISGAATISAFSQAIDPQL